MGPSFVLAVLAGVAVAASAGLRAFLPLLALGLGARFGAITLDDRVAWLGSDVTIVCLAVATLVEILGDKIPAVDHALDAAGTVLRPLAATFGAYVLLIDLPTPWAQILALVLGIGTLGLHLLKAKLRLASSAFTLGLANPVLSTAEDAVSGLLAIAAMLAPVLGLALILIVILIWRKRRYRSLTAPSPQGETGSRPQD